MQLDRRTFLGAVGVTTATAAVGSSTLLAGAAEAAPRVQRVLARDMRVPWGLDFLPDGDALVTERTTAKVFRVRSDGGKHHVGTVPNVATDRGEGGLLGLAVSPDFAHDRQVYVYCTTSSDNRLLRCTYDQGALSDFQVLLSGIGAAVIHNGGRIAFGPSGHLFIGTGENGHDLTAPADQSWAQDTDRLEGKILRVNPDGSAPGDNPFGNEVWTYGHRNVQGLAWDPSGRMWATELGQNARDELNRILKGHNYGWPIHEGHDGGDADTKDPFVTWHPTSTCSPSGVAIAHGQAWVGALAGESLYSVRLSGPNARTRHRWFRGRFGRIRTVAAAPDGSLWLTTSNRDGRATPGRHDDRVIRVTL